MGKTQFKKYLVHENDLIHVFTYSIYLILTHLMNLSDETHEKGIIEKLLKYPNSGI